MSQQGISEINQFVNQYMQIWNEPDAELRRKSIVELWVEEGTQFTRRHEYRGYEALEERVTSAHEQFVKTGGFVFKIVGEIESHHNAVKFSWEMVPADGGKAQAVGTIFFLLSGDGRIQLDYQF
ncbi:MAG TPA: hypothetical protein VKR06_39820 [Ktedonosporobacter sp.]|nr:hypothetical protein [Ktedonosporobacter sp.]